MAIWRPKLGVIAAILLLALSHSSSPPSQKRAVLGSLSRKTRVVGAISGLLAAMMRRGSVRAYDTGGFGTPNEFGEGTDIFGDVNAVDAPDVDEEFNPPPPPGLDSAFATAIPGTAYGAEAYGEGTYGGKTNVEKGIQTLAGANTIFEGGITATGFEGKGAGSVTNYQRGIKTRDLGKIHQKRINPKDIMTSIPGTATDAALDETVGGKRYTMTLGEIEKDKTLTEDQKFDLYLERLEKKWEQQQTLQEHGLDPMNMIDMSKKRRKKPLHEKESWMDNVLAQASIVENEDEKYTDYFGKREIPPAILRAQEEEKAANADHELHEFLNSTICKEIEQEILESNPNAKAAIVKERLEFLTKSDSEYLSWGKGTRFWEGIGLPQDIEELYGRVWALSEGSRIRTIKEEMDSDSAWQPPPESLGKKFRWMGKPKMTSDEYNRKLLKKARRDQHRARKQYNKRYGRKKRSYNYSDPFFWYQPEEENATSEHSDPNVVRSWSRYHFLPPDMPLEHPDPASPFTYVGIYIPHPTYRSNQTSCLFPIRHVNYTYHTLGWLRKQISNHTTWPEEDLLLLDQDQNVIHPSNNSKTLWDLRILIWDVLTVYNLRGNPVPDEVLAEHNITEADSRKRETMYQHCKKRWMETLGDAQVDCMGGTANFTRYWPEPSGECLESLKGVKILKDECPPVKYIIPEKLYPLDKKITSSSSVNTSEWFEDGFEFYNSTQTPLPESSETYTSDESDHTKSRKRDDHSQEWDLSPAPRKEKHTIDYEEEFHTVVHKSPKTEGLQDVINVMGAHNKRSISPPPFRPPPPTSTPPPPPFQMTTGIWKEEEFKFSMPEVDKYGQGVWNAGGDDALEDLAEAAEKEEEKGKSIYDDT
ncbi:hypothetical protein AAMO2058_000025700 [Amorphochlora amoebiformis]